MRCAIWQHLYIYKIRKTPMVECCFYSATLLKVKLLHGRFFKFIKLYKWYQVMKSIPSDCVSICMKLVISQSQCRGQSLQAVTCPKLKCKNAKLSKFKINNNGTKITFTKEVVLVSILLTLSTLSISGDDYKKENGSSQV